MEFFKRKDDFVYRGKTPPSPQRWPDAPRDGIAERLQALKAWESRLRGHSVFDAHVELEPAFVPFTPGLSARAGGWESPHQAKADVPARVCFHLLFPADQLVQAAQLAGWLGALRQIRWPVSMEVIGDRHGLLFQISCAQGDIFPVGPALHQHFPGAEIEMASDHLTVPISSIASKGEWLSYRWHCLELGLSSPAYYPLYHFGKPKVPLAPDPLFPLLDALEVVVDAITFERYPDSMAGLQIMAVPAHGQWSGALARMSECFEAESANKMLANLKRKLAGVGELWAVTVRTFALCGHGQGALDFSSAITRHLAEALAIGMDDSNSLVPLQISSVAMPTLHDVEARVSRRTGMILGSGELQGLLHPPTPALDQKSLLRLEPQRRELPVELTAGTMLGTVRAASQQAGAVLSGLVHWPDSYRNRHAYILGATRSGKSTLLLNMMAQDMVAGRGLFLIDPHGDLARDVLERVPKWREDDAVYLDLNDVEYPPSLGLLHTADDWEKQVLVSDLLAILSRVFSSSWGNRLEHLLRFLLMTLVADNGRAGQADHTLRDVRRLLSDERFRSDVVARLRDPDLRAFWGREFPGYSASSFAPIHNKLGLLLSSPVLRNIVAQPQARVDFAELIAGRKIVLVNLAQSLIGEDNATFIGALLVSKIQMTAMHALRYEASQRVPTTLYVDEFQNFMVSSFEKILSEAGKAGLSLVMANQYLEQLSGALQTGILSNVGALVSFRVSAASGQRLRSEFGNLFAPEELADQNQGQAVVRIGKASASFPVSTFAPVKPAEMGNEDGALERVQNYSRARFCRRREDVEAELFNWDETAGLESEDDFGAGTAGPKKRSKAPRRNGAGGRPSEPVRSANTDGHNVESAAEHSGFSQESEDEIRGDEVGDNIPKAALDERPDVVDEPVGDDPETGAETTEKKVERTQKIRPETESSNPVPAGEEPDVDGFFFGLPDD